jgi:3-hydroxyisobutyrate dehydrogenase-like beta-hydroxyacid dehydrogenase
MVQVALLGLGSMGTAMARRLEDAGFGLTVYNRSPGPTEEFAARNVAIGATPADATRGANVVLTMLADSAAVETVLFGDGGALVTGPPFPSILAEMSTIDVAFSRFVASRAKMLGVRYLRAPVSGNPAAVANGTLSMMVSGDPKALEDGRPVLEAIASTIHYLGHDEEARVMKLALAIMIAGTAEVLAEAVALGEAHGLDRAEILDVVRGSAVGSPFVAYKSAPLVADDFVSTFTTRLMHKDLNLIRECAAEVGLPIPVADLVHGLIEDCIAQGMGELDFIALLPRLQHAAGLRQDLPRAPDGAL